MAITMSKQIVNRTHNPAVHQLASDIIESQQREIDLMNHILDQTHEQNKVF